MRYTRYSPNGTPPRATRITRVTVLRTASTASTLHTPRTLRTLHARCTRPDLHEGEERQEEPETGERRRVATSWIGGHGAEGEQVDHQCADEDGHAQNGRERHEKGREGLGSEPLLS